MLKKFPSNKINGTKNALFFLLGAQTHHSFTFNLRFLYELKHKVCLYKTVWFRFAFINDYIKRMDSLTLKRHDSSQNQNNRKATYSFFSQSSDF